MIAQGTLLLRVPKAGSCLDTLYFLKALIYVFYLASKWKGYKNDLIVGLICALLKRKGFRRKFSSNLLAQE